MHVRCARFRSVTLALVLVFGTQAVADNPGPAKKSDSVVKVTASPEKPDASGKQVVAIKIEINKGWHIYANPIENPALDGNETKVKVAGKSSAKAINIEYPAGKLVMDAAVGNYRIYEGTITIKATIQRVASDTQPLAISIDLNACKEGKCLMPGVVKLSVP